MGDTTGGAGSLFGLKTFGSDGKVNFSSNGAESKFFAKNITVASSQSIDLDGFVEAGALVSPLEGYRFRFVDGVYPAFYISASGDVNETGTTYFQPSLNRLSGSGSFLNFQFERYIPTSVNIYGSLTSDVTGDYGMSCMSTTGKVAVSSQYRSYYVHPDGYGNEERSGVANSIPSYVPGSIGDRASWFQQPSQQNIYFDKPYTNPPLIFITKSSGSVAFNGMIRDANGKYVGASVVSPSNLIVPSYDWSGLGAYQATSCTFSYFIVSEEIPVYRRSTDTKGQNYGAKLFGKNGELIFDGSHRVPRIKKYSSLAERPRMFFDANRAIQTSGYLWMYVPEGSGVCVNNMSAVTGHTAYSSWYLNGSPMAGPISMFGSYMRYVPNGAGQGGYFAIECSGTAAVWTIHRQYMDSWSYIYNPSNPSTFNMSLFTAEYAYRGEQEASFYGI